MKRRRIFKLAIVALLAVVIVVGVYLKQESQACLKSQREGGEDPAERAKKSGLPVIAEFGRGI
jgi:hypothetical protein